MWNEDSYVECKQLIFIGSYEDIFFVLRNMKKSKKWKTM